MIVSGQTRENITQKSFTVKNTRTVVGPDFDSKIKTFQSDSNRHFSQPALYNNFEGSSVVVLFAISNRTITITSDIWEGDCDKIHSIIQL